MFSHAQFDATRQYLNSLHKSAVVTVIMVSTSILHIFWCWLLVNYFDLDIIGLGIATMISFTWNFTVITVICSNLKELKESFFFMTKESYSEGLKDYLLIGIPSAAMLCLEWGGMEILALVASAISIDAVAA